LDYFYLYALYLPGRRKNETVGERKEGRDVKREGYLLV